MPSIISLDRPGSSQTATETDRFVDVLARKLLHNRRRDLPASGAWGLSPAEIYLAGRLSTRQTAKEQADRPAA